MTLSVSVVRGEGVWERDLWFVICDLWFVIRDSWFVICDLWFVIRDSWWFVIRDDSWFVIRDSGFEIRDIRDSWFGIFVIRNIRDSGYSWFGIFVIRDIRDSGFGIQLKNRSTSKFTEVLQKTYRRLTEGLQKSYRRLTEVLQKSYRSLTEVLQKYYWIPKMANEFTVLLDSKNGILWIYSTFRFCIPALHTIFGQCLQKKPSCVNFQTFCFYRSLTGTLQNSRSRIFSFFDFQIYRNLAEALQKLAEELQYFSTFFDFFKHFTEGLQKPCRRLTEFIQYFTRPKKLTILGSW